MKIIEFLERMVPSNLKTETFHPQDFYDIVRVNLRIKKIKSIFSKEEQKPTKKSHFCCQHSRKKEENSLVLRYRRLI
jgi:hypothetical protein